MALAFLSAGDEGGIGSLFESPEQLDGFHPPTAHQTNDSYIRRVLQTHRTGQVRRGISAVVAAEC
jgi:hypothetical protein